MCSGFYTFSIGDYVITKYCLYFCIACCIKQSLFMEKKITNDTVPKVKKERKNKVVLEKLTSIALKMREIRRKATKPK